MRQLRVWLGLLLICSLMLLKGQLTLAVANTPTDLPRDHWAAQAVTLLLDKGYLQLYQDQTFKGEQSIDRYTLAVVVGKILNEIAAGRVGTSKEDVALLRQLTTEFRTELVDLSTKGGYFNRRIDNLTKQDQIIKEDLTKNTAEQTQLRQEVQQILTEIAETKQRVKLLEDENVALKMDVARLKAESGNQRLYIIAAIVLGVLGILR